MATHSSILGWEIPWTEERSLAGYSPWGHKESDMTEQLTLSLSLGIKAYVGVKDLACVRLRCDWSRSLGWGWGQDRVRVGSGIRVGRFGNHIPCGPAPRSLLPLGLVLPWGRLSQCRQEGPGPQGVLGALEARQLHLARDLPERDGASMTLRVGGGGSGLQREERERPPHRGGQMPSPSQPVASLEERALLLGLLLLLGIQRDRTGPLVYKGA